jgi:purine nucleoside phosphorylase
MAKPPGAVTFGQICGRPVAFLARHGYGHTIPPHEVNYQANIWALCKRGVTRIVSVASVGCIRADLKPGDVVIPASDHRLHLGAQVDLPRRAGGLQVTHIDFTEPYDEALRQQLIAGGFRCRACHQRQRGLCRDAGPRLETAAEINRWSVMAPTSWV